MQFRKAVLGVLGLTAALSASVAPPASAATLNLYVYSYQNPSEKYQEVELYASAWSGCSIKNYSWNFGDGSAQSGASAYSVYHSWNSTGSKNVTTTVTDTCGNSATATYVQTVIDPVAPTAAFSTTVSSSNPLTIYADPADSTDTSPTPLYYYEWYWGDGSYSDSYESDGDGGLVSHTYARAGTYTVTMYAYDTNYNSDTATKSVTVVDTVPNCTITGTSANDVLVGTANADTICGLGGDDQIKGQGGNDTIIGGPGVDAASFADATGPVTANLATETATGQGTDTLREIENLIGSRYNDKLDGNAAANVLNGGAGGVDGLWGQAGNDYLIGGAGNDTLGGGQNDDRVNGGTGVDYVHFGKAIAVNANLTTGVSTGEGRDTISLVENIQGSPGADTLTGRTGVNILQGGGGDDTIVGQDGNDKLYGAAGYDSLTGGVGTDLCDGGTQNDTAATCETRVSIP